MIELILTGHYRVRTVQIWIYTPIVIVVNVIRGEVETSLLSSLDFINPIVQAIAQKDSFSLHFSLQYQFEVAQIG